MDIDQKIKNLVQQDHQNHGLHARDHILLQVLKTIDPCIGDLEDYINVIKALAEATIITQLQMASHIEECYIPKPLKQKFDTSLDKVREVLGIYDFNMIVLGLLNDFAVNSNDFDRWFKVSLEAGTDIEGNLEPDYFEKLAEYGFDITNFPFKEMDEYMEKVISQLDKKSLV